MSIATLKRKTLAKYNNSSVGEAQFSLNGTRRSAGYVGQDTLGRSLIRSLSRNGALKGHGGCCGKYPIMQIKTSPEMLCINDTSIVKSTSLTTSGLFMTRHRWIRRPQPYSSTKPSNYLNNNDQSSYIDYLARKTLLDSSNCHIVANAPSPTCGCSMSMTNYNMRSNIHTNITKPDSFTGAIAESEYIRNLEKSCPAKDDFKIPKTIKNVPFACGKTDVFIPITPE